MKAMKKLLALVMALALCLSLGVCAMADDDKTLSQDTSGTVIYIPKTFTVAGNATESPATSFSLTVDKLAVTNSSITSTSGMPALSATGVTYEANKAGGIDTDVTGISNWSISLVDTSGNALFTTPGIYYYTVSETAGSQAGVTYDSNTYVLKVTVTQTQSTENGTTTITNSVSAVLYKITDETYTPSADNIASLTSYASKVTGITNTYTASNLEITKTISGNLADANEYFAVTVTLTGETGKTYDSSYSVSGVDASVTYNGSTVSNPTTVTVTADTATPAIFYIKAGQTIVIDNLPNGVTYTVAETTPSNYTATYTSTGTEDGETYATDSTDTTKQVSFSGTIDSTTDKVTINNYANVSTDTGVSLDSLPYVLVLVGVLALGAVLIVRKRRVED